ncbi:MAG: type II toxin-antitoxin system RelE/ParE family toxin [Niastella sp.]|nr:type II toxin-antitoxin system RelE/ParE family toxin [Niastella sp.]
MANFILSKKAVEDLSSIWNYTFDTWSEKQADTYYNLLLESFRELAATKFFGKQYPDIDKEIYGFRIGQHIIFYRFIKNNKIEIVKILNSRMDLRNRISE